MTRILLSRRGIAPVAAALSAGLGRGAQAQDARRAPIARPIPSSGERIPVIGLGTNQYSVSTPEEMTRLQGVLETMLEQGGSVVDTARVYGRAEEVIGELLRRIGRRDRVFVVTKTPIRGELRAPEVEIQASFDRLGLDRIDAMLIHNLHGLDALMPALLRAKQAGRIRYVGMSTSEERQYDAQMQAMRRYPLDVIQVDYSIANRAAAQEMLPLAAERGIAVMVNQPFGGRNAAGTVFGRLRGRALPGWAADIDAESWGQVLLKYIVSHPAVTVAIPGTIQARHMIDNQGAGRGRLPDAALRREMERYWDAL